MVATHWKDRAQEKKRQQLESIPKDWVLTNLPDKSQLDVSDFPRTCGLLSERDIEITESDVEVILSNLSKGTWSAVEVTMAFSKRAVIAHQLVNCLTEIFIERALVRAAELDAHFKQTGRVVGPLHGLPISLKDQVCIKGIDSTMGYVAWIGKPVTKNAVITDILESMGAILYVKTNVPQTLLWAETYNHIFGRTSNPFNRSLTCGGSSGGEGALVALRGSPLGVASDLAGSIRSPAAFNGVYGFRPSFHRTPFAGCVNSFEGQMSVVAVLGPISNSLGGVKTFMKNVISREPWRYDALTIRKKWNEEEYSLVEHGGGRQLCFAVMWDDGLTKPHPPILRGLETAKEALIRAGHKVVDWKPFKHAEISDLGAEFWGSAGKQEFEAVTALSGEPIISSMSPEIEDFDSPPKPDPNRYPALNLTAFEYWQVNVRQREARQAFLDHWRETECVTGTGRPVDAIITPTAPHVAPPHGTNLNVSYTVFWSILDCPACIVPVSKVDPTLDAKWDRDSFLTDSDRQNWNSYDPDTFRNAPVSIQIVGRTLDDEALLGMSEIVDDAVKAYQSDSDS